MKHYIIGFFLWLSLVPPAGAEETSLRDLPKAEQQLQNYLSWVLRDRQYPHAEGTFYVSRLQYKVGCNLTRPVKRTDMGLMWERYYDDLVVLNDTCLKEKPVIFWVEGKALIEPVFISDLLYGAAIRDVSATTPDADIRLQTLPHSYVDLATDVVPTVAEVNGSTHLVDSATAFERVRSALNGDKMIVAKQRRAKQ